MYVCACITSAYVCTYSIHCAADFWQLQARIFIFILCHRMHLGACKPYSEQACRDAALTLGLQLGLTSDPHSFSGSSLHKGCYAYKSGQYAGRAFYSTGGTVEAMQRAVPQDRYRPKNYDCAFGNRSNNIFITTTSHSRMYACLACMYVTYAVYVCGFVRACYHVWTNTLLPVSVLNCPFVVCTHWFDNTVNTAFLLALFCLINHYMESTSLPKRSLCHFCALNDLDLCALGVQQMYSWCTRRL